MNFGAALDRLVRPLDDTLDYTGIITYRRKYVLLFFLREMAERKRSFWGWSTEEWIDSIDAQFASRHHAVAIAYLLCGFSDLHRLRATTSCTSRLARKIFGREHMRNISDRVQGLLLEWGYVGRRYAGAGDANRLGVFMFRPIAASERHHSRSSTRRNRTTAASHRNLLRFRDLSGVGEDRRDSRAYGDRAPIYCQGRPSRDHRRRASGVGCLCRRWFDTSTGSDRDPRKNYYFLLNIGRWLAHKHPR